MATKDGPNVVASGMSISPTMPNPPSSGAKDGYTLIEVLVVLAIASIMAAMMIGGVRQLRGLLDLGERSAAHSVAEAVADHVADNLTGALELPLLGSASDEHVSLVGSRDEVRFNAVIRIGFLTRALREVAFGVKTPGGRSALVRTSLPRRLGKTERRSSEEELVLHPDVVGITFRYMTMDLAGNTIWSDDWSGRPLLPIAVQFQIAVSTKGEQIRVSRTVGMLH
ncbi:general secretion pathway protein J [Sinorhizobium fredii USDA 205]|nr:prepilin-type N-terminal cleavage/methylation domain-containing protein [Sinorhizobium fredii]KSV87540.1 general secretion pathway protein J [Sinorhizobium fredii USDA 205]MQW93584.1 prepilin-type N-terminal cleavage/methylation domain-containing protein [Sinorhizobium fredii]MQX11223.1 prepilin-type N-terminal cleavage/methylation domain-containing protein [Sinorhizobium fredii]UTY50384.1 prepilin-type N-terminal cleavage/methylation domain-containing protein [Sinorhizobium fredii]